MGDRGEDMQQRTRVVAIRTEPIWYERYPVSYRDAAVVFNDLVNELSIYFILVCVGSEVGEPLKRIFLTITSS